MLATSLAIFVALLCIGTVVASSNCTAVRSEAMGIASEAAQGFEASSVLRFDDRDYFRKNLLWSGKKTGLSLHLYEASEEKGVQISPVRGNDGNIEVTVTIPKGLSESESKAMVSKMSASFIDQHSSNHCITKNVDTYIHGKELFQNYDYDPKFPGWFGCFLCASSLGIAIPIVLNLAIGEGFSYWCQKQGGDETDCDTMAISVVLALEMPIVFIGGLTIDKICFQGRDCTPSSKATEAPKQLF